MSFAEEGEPSTSSTPPESESTSSGGWGDLLTFSLRGEQLLGHRASDGTEWVFRSQIAAVFGLESISASTLRRAYKVSGCSSSAVGPAESLVELRKRGIVKSSATHANMVSLKVAESTLRWLEQRDHLQLRRDPSPSPPLSTVWVKEIRSPSPEEEEDIDEEYLPDLPANEDEEGSDSMSCPSPYPSPSPLKLSPSPSPPPPPTPTPPALRSDDVSPDTSQPTCSQRSSSSSSSSSGKRPSSGRCTLVCYTGHVEGLDGFLDWMSASKLDGGVDLSESTVQKTRQKITCE